MPRQRSEILANGATASEIRYVEAGFSCRHVTVCMPPGAPRSLTSRPLETTVSLAGTVAASSQVALSAGAPQVGIQRGLPSVPPPL